MVPHFKAHQPTPPSSSPPASESSLVMCHASKLTNPFLPLPPLQLVSPHLCCAAFQSSPTCSSLFLPLASESSLVICHASKLTNPLLPLPPLQLVSPHLCLAML